MEIFRVVLVLTAFMNVVISDQMDGLTYSKRMRGRRSGHLTGTVPSFNKPNESTTEVNNQTWRHVTSIWKEKGISEPSGGEVAVGNSTQSDRGVTISLEKSTNVVSVLHENSSIQPEKEYQQQIQNAAGNDQQMLSEHTSSLHQYSNGTARKSETQLQHHTLNNNAKDMRHLSSEDITINVNTQYSTSTSRSYMEDGSDLSSAEITASHLPSHSLEHKTLSAKLHDMVTLSPSSLHTSNHDEVSDDSLRNSSSTKDINLHYNMSITQFFSHFMSTENSTMPFPESNRNFAQDIKQVIQAANRTTHQVQSDSTEHFSELHTTKVPDGQPILTSIPEELYKATVPTNNSFTSTTKPETMNEADASENIPLPNSESSAKSTTSAGHPSLFYSTNANINITTESPASTMTVLKNSTESRIMLGITIESPNAASADVPQTSNAPVHNKDHSPTSLVTTVPSSLPSTSISTMESLETWVTHTAAVMPSTEAIISNVTSTIKLSDVAINSRKISSTTKPAASVTSSTVSRTPKTVTVYKNVPSLESVSERTPSNTVPSIEYITSSGISSTMQFVETKTVDSSSVQSSGTVYSGLISSAAPSSTTINSNTISGAMPSTGTATSHTIPTFLIIMPSVNYQMPTSDTTKGNEYQVDITGKNESSHSIEKEMQKSFTILGDTKSNAITLNDTCEKMFCKSEKLTNKQKKNAPLTIVLRSEMEVAEWFLIWDMDFRKYISNALTQYKETQEKWNKTFSPEDILYVTPGPFANGINLSMCIIVRSFAQKEENMFLSGKYLQKCLEEMTTNLKEMLHLEIIDTSIGILTTQHHCRTPEKDGNQMTVTIAMTAVTVIFMITIAALTLTMKCQQHHHSFEAPSGISYRIPSLSAGRHLATDDDCTAMEGRNSLSQEVKEEKANGSTPSTPIASANVTLISKEEHEKWVVPYDEIIIQGERSIGHEDTRL